MLIFFSVLLVSKIIRKKHGPILFFIFKLQQDILLFINLPFVMISIAAIPRTQNLNCASNSELMPSTLSASDRQFFPKLSVVSIESNIHKYYLNFFKKLGQWWFQLTTCCGLRMGMNWHLWKKALVMYSVLLKGTRAVDTLHFSTLIDLFHPLTVLQNCFICSIVFLLLVDEKEINSQMEVSKKKEFRT